jgi:hypothetical protein
MQCSRELEANARGIFNEGIELSQRRGLGGGLDRRNTKKVGSGGRCSCSCSCCPVQGAPGLANVSQKAFGEVTI